MAFASVQCQSLDYFFCIYYKGIDPRLWKQAQLDNPDPKKLIPVPMIGFRALQQRILCQEQLSKTFEGRLDCVAQEISDLQKRHQDTLAKLR